MGDEHVKCGLSALALCRGANLCDANLCNANLCNTNLGGVKLSTYPRGLD
ncbi:MAG: pentapeptide repeat-containing protein [Shewanella sp.]